MKMNFKYFLVAMALLLICNFNVRSETPGSVEIEWYGHACFLLTLESGVKILTDPYDTSWVPYQLPVEKVDIIFSTHDHYDHNAVDAVPSDAILKPTGSEATFSGSKNGSKFENEDTLTFEIKGAEMTFTTIPSYHDERSGELRGVNGIVKFTVAGMTFVHLGDLGHKLTSIQAEQLKPVDVLMIPVGGYYTIDAKTAREVVTQLSPWVVFPMHYKTDVLPEEFPIEGVNPFLEGYNNINRNESSAISLKSDELPRSLTIEVLKYHGQK